MTSGTAKGGAAISVGSAVLRVTALSSLVRGVELSNLSV